MTSTRRLSPCATGSKVEVEDASMGGDSGAGLAAKPGLRRVSQGGARALRAPDQGHAARVVAVQVRGSAAPARPFSEGQGEL